jgi:hypothetical protein
MASEDDRRRIAGHPAAGSKGSKTDDPTNSVPKAQATNPPTPPGTLGRLLIFTIVGVYSTWNGWIRFQCCPVVYSSSRSRAVMEQAQGPVAKRRQSKRPRSFSKI